MSGVRGSSPMNNRERGDRVRHQIQLRLDTLRGWSSNGVPSGQEIPRSLNRVRLWEDPDLGISKIGSPSSFTTTHPEHGASIEEIASLLEVLVMRQREAEPDDTRLATQLGNERRRSAALKQMLQESANLYVAITVELEGAMRDLRVTRQSVEALTARNADVTRENGELRRRLAKYSTSELVTDLRPRRST